MTKRRKRKKESSGSLTTLFEIMFGGLAGAAVAAVWLMLKPVAIVDSPRRNADEMPVRHAINYQPGKLGLVRESQVKVKEQAVLQQSGTEVSLSEQEINRWLVTRYGATPATDVMGTGVELRPEPPLVRMVGDEMQVGVVYSFSGYDGKKNLVLQARGHFDRSASGGFEFVPTKAYLGSCPLPNGFVSRFVVNSFLSVFSVPEELNRAWFGLRDVALADNHLKLQFGGVAPAPAPKLQPAPDRVATPTAEVSSPVDGAVAADEEVSEPDVSVEASTVEEAIDLATTAEEVVAALPAANAAMETPEPEAQTEGPGVGAELVEEGAIAVPAEVQENPAPTPTGENEAAQSAAQDADASDTMTVEAVLAEEKVPSGPLESN